MNSRNPYVAAARELVEAFDYAALSVEHGGKHPKVVVDLGNVVIRHAFPGTPSGHRSLLNWRAQFKRRLVAATQPFATAHGA